jgi:hypothetical protein
MESAIYLLGWEATRRVGIGIALLKFIQLLLCA